MAREPEVVAARDPGGQYAGAQPDMPEGMVLAGPSQSGELMVGNVGGVITAQKIAVPRDEGKIREIIKGLAARNGHRYIYRIPFKNNRTGETQIVQGPTIKLANTIARYYGNALVQVRSYDSGSHWVFVARMTDLESGSSMERAFQQRKGQNTGMKDRARAEDIIFQIGQSKAIRNVVVNFLQDLVDFALDECENEVYNRAKANPEKAMEFIRGACAELGVELRLVERMRGRKLDRMKPGDLAQTYMELTAIRDGVISWQDLYAPGEGDEDERPAASERAEPSGSHVDSNFGGDPEPKREATAEVKREPEGGDEDAKSEAAAAEAERESEGDGAEAEGESAEAKAEPSGESEDEPAGMEPAGESEPETGKQGSIWPED